jgi:hypothetical protein
MFVFALSLTLISCEDDSADDFWDKLASDEVVVEENVEGRMYEKARFYCPIQRRLRLYPGAHKAITRLQGCSRMEFIYDAKVPSLVFLDSQDVTVEKLDICKMSEDEIVGVLNLRGFSAIPEEPEGGKTADDANSTETAASNETTAGASEEQRTQEPSL